MGRRDAVATVLEVVARCKQILPRLRVDFEAGWQIRGNGTSANYEGGSVHHTGFKAGALSVFPARSTLLGGRVDLSGPLTNFGGPWCTVENPVLTVVAAHPANHAGASGGRSMGPLPVTGMFNSRVLALEIDYAGLTPMSAGQLLVAQVWARAVADVVGGGNIEVVRAHAETSITGKWDPGVGNGKAQTLNMAEFRRGAWQITTTIGDDDMPLTADEIERIADRTLAKIATAANPWGLDALLTRLIRTEKALIAADANDSPKELAAALGPLLVPMLVPTLAAGLKKELAANPATSGPELTEERMLALTDSAVRKVLGSLDDL